MFQNQAALAGNPVQVVSGAFLAKWAQLGYEAGAAGPPTSAQNSVLTFRATLGNTQTFANGIIAGAANVYFVGGLIAAAYAGAGAAAGSLGLPLSDANSSSFPQSAHHGESIRGADRHLGAGRVRRV